jgi:hypothetical protein
MDVGDVINSPQLQMNPNCSFPAPRKTSTILHQHPQSQRWLNCRDTVESQVTPLMQPWLCMASGLFLVHSTVESPLRRLEEPSEDCVPPARRDRPPTIVPGYIASAALRGRYGVPYQLTSNQRGGSTFNRTGSCRPSNNPVATGLRPAIRVSRETVKFTRACDEASVVHCLRRLRKELQMQWADYGVLIRPSHRRCWGCLNR